MKKRGASFLVIYRDAIINNNELLLQARLRGDTTKDARLNMPLGEGSRTQFLAHTGFATMEEAIIHTQVVYKLKRKAILRIGDIHLIAGRFGVIVYDLPSDLPITAFQHSQESILDSRPFLEQIGATADGRDGMDTVYNYSGCHIAALKQREIAA